MFFVISEILSGNRLTNKYGLVFIANFLFLIFSAISSIWKIRFIFSIPSGAFVILSINNLTNVFIVCLQ